MSNPFERTIIPLSDAQRILLAFGIGPSSQAYQRWRRDDGFRWGEFEDVLNESDKVLSVDWHEWLQDAVELIIGQCAELGLEAAADLGEDGEQGVFKVGGKIERIKFTPADSDNFDHVIAVINRLFSPAARYRKFRSCEGSDGWLYAVLKNDEWRSIGASAGNTIDLLFTEVDSG